MIRRVVYLLLVFAILAAQPTYVSAQYQPPNPCPMEIYWEWYSDYFQTAVGFKYSYCDCSQWAWGAQDGEYLFQERTSCSSGTGSGTCYQKVNGSWVQISCP